MNDSRIPPRPTVFTVMRNRPILLVSFASAFADSPSNISFTFIPQAEFVKYCERTRQDAATPFTRVSRLHTETLGITKPNPFAACNTTTAALVFVRHILYIYT